MKRGRTTPRPASRYRPSREGPGRRPREQAIEAAKDHVRTQFQRIGLDSEDVTITLKEM